MNEIDKIYLEILKFGFIILRLDARAGRTDHVWVGTEHLHNIPSLIGETNLQRHRYYWQSEMPTYCKWLENHGDEETLERMRSIFPPLWNRLAHELVRLGNLEHGTHSEGELSDEDTTR